MRVNLKSWGVGLSFLVVTLLGNGAYWEYQRSQIEKRRVELEAKKQEVDSMVETIELRGKLTEVLYKLSSLAGQYHEVLAAKGAGQEKVGVYPIELKMKLLDAEADQLLSDYEAIEGNVAKLEGRPPRKLNVHHFKPPSQPMRPQNIRIEP
jgi:hypothetical protein